MNDGVSMRYFLKNKNRLYISIDDLILYFYKYIAEYGRESTVNMASIVKYFEEYKEETINRS